MPSETLQEPLCVTCGEGKAHRVHRLPHVVGDEHRFVTAEEWERFRRLLNAAYVGGTDHAGS